MQRHTSLEIAHFDGWSFYGENDMENPDLQELGQLPLPTKLDRWSDHNLIETYNYTKRADLKVFIASEFWWRTEMLELANIREIP